MGDDAPLDEDAGKRSKSKYLCEKHGHTEFSGPKHRCPKESCTNILKRLCTTCNTYFSYTHISNHKKVCQEDTLKLNPQQKDSSSNQMVLHSQVIMEYGHSSFTRFYCKTHGPQNESAGTYRCPQENCGHSLKRLCVFCKEYFWSSTLWHHRPKCQARASVQPKETMETNDTTEKIKKRSFEQTADSPSHPRKNVSVPIQGDDTDALTASNAGINRDTSVQPSESSNTQTKIKCSFSLLLDTSSVLMEAKRNSSSTIETMPVRLPSFNQNTHTSIPIDPTQPTEEQLGKSTTIASDHASS